MRNVEERDLRKVLKCGRCSNFIEGKDSKSILKIADEDGWKADKYTDEVFCPDCWNDKEEEEEILAEGEAKHQRSLLREMSLNI